MAADRSDDGTEAWLDALAGRTAGGPDEADARALRDALLPAPDQTRAPDWALLAARADSAAPLPDVAPQPAAQPGLHRAEAANHPQWRQRLGWAAALVLGTAWLVTLWQSNDESVLRGGAADPATAQAQWQVADPTAAAQALAAQLRQAGAEVHLLERPDGLLMRVSTPASHRDAVNAQLQALDTAVNSQGVLELWVRKAP